MSNQITKSKTELRSKNGDTLFARRAPNFNNDSITKDDLQRINRLAPNALRENDVYVRSMYLCSTQPCKSDGCQFTQTALNQIAEKIIGQSVLIGHDRSSLPLARFFKSNVIQRGENAEGDPIYFVRAWFYWLRDTSGAKDLLLNIDGGIYREVSLAWKFDTWRCSTCLSENSRCNHRVGETYNGKVCYRLIDHVTKVLEGSLVYKGADKDTHLAGARTMDSHDHHEPILLIGECDDPLFDTLESLGVLEDKRALDDYATSLQESVDRLWIRSRDEKESDKHKRNGWPQNLLTHDGVCLSELVSCKGGDLLDCHVSRLFTRDTDIPLPTEATYQEVNHDTLWAL